MRRSRTLLLLALALVFGGLAAYLTLQLLEERTAPLPLAAQPPSSQVVVAARPLTIGQLLSEEDVKVVAWPGNAAPEGYAGSVADVVGRGVITQVALNEPLLDSKLADRGQGGLRIAIPEGMRAAPVSVDNVIGVAGFVTPGTRVDVFWTGEDEGSGGTVTKLFMQNVQILAIDQQANRDPQGNPIPGATVATVLVTPEDAEKMILAASRGRIQMALRNLIDVREVTTDGARVAELLEGTGARRRVARTGTGTAAPQPAANENVLRIIKGGNKALIQF